MSRKTDLGMIVTTPINFKSIQALDAFEAELKKQWSVLNHNKQVHDGNKVSFELRGFYLILTEVLIVMISLKI